MNILTPLLLTILIEFLFVFFYMRRECGIARIAFAVIAVNLLTNPLANYLYPEYSFWLIEAGVVMAEVFLFALLFEVDLKKGAVISIVANIPTILVSLII